MQKRRESKITGKWQETITDHFTFIPLMQRTEPSREPLSTRNGPLAPPCELVTLGDSRTRVAPFSVTRHKLWHCPQSARHRFLAPSSKLCQIWLRRRRGTLCLRAAVHRRGQRSPKGLDTDHTPSTAFRHLPPNSARFSYATEGALFISAQLSIDTVSALRKVWLLI